MTDQQKLSELRNRINEAAEEVTMLPVQRTMGAGVVVGSDIVVAIPVIRWNAILEELDRE